MTVGWQKIESAPLDQNVLFAYFGYHNRPWHRFCAVVKQFRWEGMPKPLATGWPKEAPDPTHWMPLPSPPEIEQ
jgi:hypothetical protein